MSLSKRPASPTLQTTQPPTNPFETLLPLELTREILCWLHPTIVFRYRRLSHAFNNLLTSKPFIRQSLARVHHHHHNNKLQTTKSTKPTDTDILMIHLPEEYKLLAPSIHCATVTELSWSHEPLIAPIPMNLLSSLQGLTHLTLKSCQLHGTIPPQLCNLTHLESLCLDGNALEGEIPREIGNLVNLRMLSLGENNLTGVLPVELFRLVNLEELYLSSNGLCGVIPAEIGQLLQLKELFMSWNQLSGEIPEEIGRLVNLTKLFLNGNKLTGRIPETVIQVIFMGYLF